MDKNIDSARYNCPRCHYKTDARSHFINHLHNKTPCPSLYSEQSQSDILSSIVKAFKCPHCDKSFTKANNLSRHKKVHTPEEIARTVAINTNNTNTNNISDSHDTTNINNTTNNSHDTNTNIQTLTIEHLTIQLLPFGKEDISQIQNDTEFLNRCIREGVERAIPLIVKQIFLNDDLPQNKNIRMGKNHPPSEMLVYRAEIQGAEPAWEHAPRDMVLQDLVDKGATVLQTHNSHIYHTSQKTLDDSDDYDRRNGKIINAKAGKRGTGKIKVAVLDKIKDHERKQIVG